MPKTKPKKAAARKSPPAPPPEPKHDSREAIDLLAAGAQAATPDVKGAEEAACALLNDLLALAGKTRARITADRDGTVEIKAGDRTVWVKTGDRDGGLKMKSADRDWTFVSGLSYNPATRLYVADAFDDNVAPVPGKPFPLRRSALAVVVEAALQFVGLLPPPTPLSRR